MQLLRIIWRTGYKVECRIIGGGGGESPEYKKNSHAYPKKQMQLFTNQSSLLNLSNNMKAMQCTAPSRRYLRISSRFSHITILDYTCIYLLLFCYGPCYPPPLVPPPLLVWWSKWAKGESLHFSVFRTTLTLLLLISLNWTLFFLCVYLPMYLSILSCFFRNDIPINITDQFNHKY